MYEVHMKTHWTIEIKKRTIVDRAKCISGLFFNIAASDTDNPSQMSPGSKSCQPGGLSASKTRKSPQVGGLGCKGEGVL
jgi:hypothetical protein